MRMFEWNSLIRVALLELNDALGTDTISEDNEAISFPEYQKRMEQLASTIPKILGAKPLPDPPFTSEPEWLKRTHR